MCIEYVRLELAGNVDLNNQIQIERASFLMELSILLVKFKFVVLKTLHAFPIII